MVAHVAELRRVPDLADHEHGYEGERDQHPDGALRGTRQQQASRGGERRDDHAYFLERGRYRERSVHIRLVAFATSGLSARAAGHWSVPVRMTKPLPSV